MTAPTLAPAAFAQKWRRVTTTEKAASQVHFIDLCRMLGEQTPDQADPTGTHSAFEKRVCKGRRRRRVRRRLQAPLLRLGAQGHGQGPGRLRPAHEDDQGNRDPATDERVEVDEVNITSIIGSA